MVFTIEKIASNYFGQAKFLLDRLKKGKRYLKIGFSTDCNDHSNCPSHCLSFALSYPKASSLSKERHCMEGHNGSCKDCSNLLSDLEEQRQNNAKMDAFDSLGDSNCLWIRDLPEGSTYAIPRKSMQLLWKERKEFTR